MGAILEERSLHSRGKAKSRKVKGAGPIGHVQGGGSSSPAGGGISCKLLAPRSCSARAGSGAREERGCWEDGHFEVLLLTVLSPFPWIRAFGLEAETHFSGWEVGVGSQGGGQGRARSKKSGRIGER